MLNRILVVLVVGLLSLAAYQAFMLWNRKHADAVSLEAKQKPFDGQPHILYFRSETCTSCATQARLFEQDGEIQSLVHKVNVDQQPELAKQYGVMTVPTLMLVDAQGNTRKIYYGVVHPRKLKQQMSAI